jgi:FecR protein
MEVLFMTGAVRNRVLLLFLFLILSTVSFAAGQGEPIDPVTLEGELVYMQGEVLINSETVEVGDAVLPGDRIVTGADGIAEISFGPRNILQFREETNAVIEAAWRGVELEKGTIAAVLNGLARLGFGDQKRFEVRTATAAMGVRGTAFFIVHPDADQAYFCTCNGKLHLEAPGGAVAQDTEAYHHSAVWYVRTPGGIQSLPSGLHYHDDDTLNEIARRAGTTVRWRD